MKLKIRLLETAARDMTITTRAMTDGGRSTDFFGRLAGAISSRGTSTRNSTPHTIASVPGTAKAARQPACCTRKPVRIAATAIPRLPASPLTPIVKPGLRAFCTSIGMPTG